MIIAIREDGEVRIFDSEGDVQKEWGPYPRDVQSDVVVFYAEDGAWLKPTFSVGQRRWFGLRSGAVTFELAKSEGLEYEDPIALALVNAKTLLPNSHFGSMNEIKARFPYESNSMSKSMTNLAAT